MSENYEAQKDEINLLENIIPDKLKISQEKPTYSLEIWIEGNVEEPKMYFELKVELPENYPNDPPKFTLTEENNFLATAKLKKLNEDLISLCSEYASMPVIYQLYEAIQTFADEEEQSIINERKKKAQIKLEEEKKLIEAQKKEEEEKLLQNISYTPVTKELFNEWYKKFVDKIHKAKQKNLTDGKMTGREFFLNKNIKIEEINEDEIETEKIDKKDNVEENLEGINAEMFEDDIDEIDFENDDINV